MAKWHYYMICRVVSGWFHVKNNTWHLNGYSLCTFYVSPQMYLGLSCMSRQKFPSSVLCTTGKFQSISLCPMQCWLVTCNWLQIFSYTFTLKKHFHWEAVKTKFLKTITGLWSFIFQCLLIFGCLSPGRPEKHLPPPLHLFCVSAGTLRCWGTQNH